MKTDEALYPLDIDLFRARAVAVSTERLPHPVEQFWRAWGGRGGTFAHAAFLAVLPWRGQEIDGKLQYNSR